MVEMIELYNFHDEVLCKMPTAIESYRSYEYIRPLDKYRLEASNVYGIICDFCTGGWGLVSCIGGRVTRECQGTVIVNGKKIAAKKLGKYSHFIPELPDSPHLFPNKKHSAREHIEKALEISGLPYSAEEIREIFHLTDVRFDRPLNWISDEIWAISTAIGFALGKDIFCFPWLNMIDIFYFNQARIRGVIDFLKSQGKIILIPSSQRDELKQYCDHTIEITREGYVFD